LLDWQLRSEGRTGRVEEAAGGVVDGVARAVRGVMEGGRAGERVEMGLRVVLERHLARFRNYM
jgi:hypothetical protein